MRADERAPLKVPERGYPFVALAVLIVVIASPIVSIGGTRPVLLGLTIAAWPCASCGWSGCRSSPGWACSGCWSWRSLGALPVAATADRGEPWFDYRSFAESLGPEDPVRFSWTQSYGPINWPRDGNEVMRVVSGEPLYWKARNLDTFNGNAWQIREDIQDTPLTEEPWESDVPEDWAEHPEWTSEIEVFVKRVQSTDVIGAGTIIEIGANSSPVQPGFSPGTWDAPRGLQRNDSYYARVHFPNPTGEGIEDATLDEGERQDGMRTLMVPFQQGQGILPPQGGFGSTRPVGEARVEFAPYGSMEPSSAEYPRRRVLIERSVDEIMLRSKYERTWELVKRMKQQSDSPLDYIRTVDAYLHRPEFRYEERPPATPTGEEPLDYFINVSHLGYCQHYAGAMALMLRMGGIPARVATGFSPGGYSESKKGLDRPRHRRPRLGRGVVRPVRLGHRGPHPVRHARPSRVASLDTAAPAAAPSASDSGEDTAPAPDDGTNPRPSGRTCRSAPTAPWPARTTAAAGAGCCGSGVIARRWRW